MTNISRVIAVINDLKDLESVAKKSVKLANIYNASIEVLFVKEEHFTLDSLFFDNEVLNKEKVEHELRDSFEKLNPPKGVAYFVKIDDTASRVWSLVRDEKDAIVVMPYYKGISKEVVNKVGCDVYILKDSININSATIVIDNLHLIDSAINRVKELNLDIDEIIYNYQYTISPNLDPTIDTSLLLEEEILKIEEKEFNKIIKSLNIGGKMFINNFYLDDNGQNYINQKTNSLIVFNKGCLDMDDIAQNLFIFTIS